MDLYLAKHDVLGSMAHITMLESIGLLTAGELEMLLAELKNIYASAEKGEFVIEDGIEDVHSQVELMLTRKLGDVGKKFIVDVHAMTTGVGGFEAVYSCGIKRSGRRGGATFSCADFSKQSI